MSDLLIHLDIEVRPLSSVPPCIFISDNKLLASLYVYTEQKAILSEVCKFSTDSAVGVGVMKCIKKIRQAD